MKNIIGKMRKTIQEYGLIQNGDRVAVALSGGKDSMALLSALKAFQAYSPIHYTLHAITVDPGFNHFNTDIMTQFCKSISVPYTIIHTHIAHIVFDVRSEANPCALCANMRRGALAQEMQKLGLNVLALGHHEDDALHTLFLNMFYAGKMNTLEFKTHLERSDIILIRPFLSVSERAIKGAVKRSSIPVAKSPCPMDKQTKREDIKELIELLQKRNPNIKKSLVAAMRNEAQFNLFANKKVPL